MWLVCGDGGKNYNFKKHFFSNIAFVLHGRRSSIADPPLVSLCIPNIVYCKRLLEKNPVKKDRKMTAKILHEEKNSYRSL